MAVLDIISANINNALKGYVMNGVVNYTGSAPTSTTKMVMRVKNTNLSNVAQADILVDVYFRFYDANEGGVRITSYEIPIPASRKVVGFDFYEDGQSLPNANIEIDLVGAEIKEFGSAGVLFIEVISVDLAALLI